MTSSRSAGTTCSRASSRRARPTARRTPCPYYAGSKYVFYRKDLFEKADIAVPTTMQEFVQAAIDLKAANPTPKNFSGFWLPGQDWRNGVTFLWDAGGDLATADGDEWDSQLSSPESVAGLQTVQQLFTEASGAAKDGNEADPQVPFCNNEIGMLSAPGWVTGLIDNAETGCPAMMKNVGVFAMPGSDGAAAPVLLGGSNIAVSAKSPNQDLAKKAVALMLSEEYQTIFAENGLTPALESLSPLLGDDEFAAGDDRGRQQREAHSGRVRLGSGRGGSHPGGPVRRDRQRR